MHGDKCQIQNGGYEQKCKQKETRDFSWYALFLKLGSGH